MKTIWILIVRLFSTYLKTKGISNTYLLFYFLFRLDSCSESHELRCVISCVYASSAILRAILLASNIPQGSQGTIGSNTFWICIRILMEHLQVWNINILEIILWSGELSKVEKILNGSLDSISSHSPSLKIQIMGWGVKAKLKLKVTGLNPSS